MKKVLFTLFLSFFALGVMADLTIADKGKSKYIIRLFGRARLLYRSRR